MTTVDPLDPGLLDGLTDLPIGDVRARREACEALETQLSYVRRLVQGRLDLVNHELDARRTGEPPGDMVEELTAALADHLVAPGLGHLPTVMAPGDIDPALLKRLDEAAPPARLTDLHQAAADELEDAAAALTAYERELSDRRRAMFQRIDALKEELVRRYRDGEADVDSLLGQ